MLDQFTIAPDAICQVARTFAGVSGLSVRDVHDRIEVAVLHGQTEAAQMIGLDLNGEYMATRITNWADLDDVARAWSRWLVVQEKAGQMEAGR